MNPQRVSEIFFEESYRVPPHQTARSLFTSLPHGVEYAHSLVDCLATSYLIAVAESVCIREMQRHVDPSEVVVGRAVHIDHVGPIPPLSCLRLCGSVERLGDQSATFFIRVQDDHEVVFEGTILLVAAQRTSMEARIAVKVAALQQAQVAARNEVSHFVGTPSLDANAADRADDTVVTMRPFGEGNGNAARLLRESSMRAALHADAYLSR